MFVFNRTQNQISGNGEQHIFVRSRPLAIDRKKKKRNKKIKLLKIPFLNGCHQYERTNGFLAGDLFVEIVFKLLTNCFRYLNYCGYWKMSTFYLGYTEGAFYKMEGILQKQNKTKQNQ